MTEIGKINKLSVVRETENGVYLDGVELGEILMPQKFVTQEVKNSGVASVFVYTDSEDRLVATTENPKAMVNDFAYMQVVSVNRYGAFLDWGLPKDLLVPFSEQKATMVEDRFYLVHIFLDVITKRLVASAKIEKFLDNTPPEYKVGEEVDLLIADETDLGFKAIINNEHWGMIYKNQVFQPIKTGQRTKGFINKIREDEKIDLLLEKPGYEKVDSIAGKILEELKENNGFMAVSDKTSPEMIQAMFGISKKNFKKAIGSLYKNRLIDFVSDGIKLIEK
ncbi:MAG: GntR family transcriptional regulator [Prolixibacteraceae bacterium]|nr:GntR family transcriptional regulator [Prolixibacteraceae bacterium]